MQREEALNRQAWQQYRSWRRITSGVLRSGIGAVQCGTCRVCSESMPHFDAQECRQYLHQVMASFGNPGKEVVMAVNHSGLQRTGKLAAPLDHYDG